MERTLSVNMPEDVFQKLYHAANFTQQTVNDVIVNLVNAMFVVPTDLSDPIVDELAAMRQMKDELLWQAIHPSVTPEQQDRLYKINALATERILSPDEVQEQQTLLTMFHHAVLRRAQAIAILTLRGHVISDDSLMQSVV